MRSRDAAPTRFVCPEGHAVWVRGADHMVGLYCEDHETMMRRVKDTGRPKADAGIDPPEAVSDDAD